MSAGYSASEIREYVAEYQRQPHGTKAKWVETQPFTAGQLRRWRDMVYAGDVDRELAARHAVFMKPTSSQLSSFERQRQRDQAAHEAEVAELRARIEQLEGSNEALGKAIGLLHQLNEQEPDTSTTNGPESSSQPRTGSSSN